MDLVGPRNSLIWDMVVILVEIEVSMSETHLKIKVLQILDIVILNFNLNLSVALEWVWDVVDCKICDKSFYDFNFLDSVLVFNVYSVQSLNPGYSCYPC